MCFYRREQIPSLQIEMDQSDYDYWKVQQEGSEKLHRKHQNFVVPRRILQSVFSVCVLSFLLWYSFGCSILPHEESMHAFFSTLLFSIFSHILERKYMFLLCNAILAFLVKTSLSISSDATDDDEFLQAPNLSDTSNAIPVSMEAPSLNRAQEQETDNKEQVEDQDDGENIEEASSVSKEEEVQVGSTREVMVGTQEEDDTTVVAAENDEEVTNADELNRKFEEFIRKMKEEIRIEAQRQLVAAV